MALKIILKPGERLVVNGALMRSNGRHAVELLMDTRARVLREAALMAEEQATTPARRLYFAAQLALIRAHPDLAGRVALAGELTDASAAEQAAAGLTALSAEELARFTGYNAAYKERFGFPFVICARENRKEAILAAFPLRLRNTRDQEIATALGEIAKIARLRLLDAVSED